jgi:hypothetical protein
MTYPISQLDGLTAQAAAKLKAQGVRTTARLLDVAGTAKGRRELAAATGISEKQILDWVNTADYMRIKGMGAGKAKLIRSTGVKTVRDLGYRNPERLAQSMAEANKKLKCVRVLPSEASVKQLIERARKLPIKISY